MITPEPTAHTLDVPGARLYYEVRGSGPLLLLVGAPMDSVWFASMADVLATEFRVVTTDPRGISRSVPDDPAQDATPELLADDVHRVIARLDAGPALFFGSSGGAVTGLALVTSRPEQVSTLVAHEPPLVELLPDHLRYRAAIDDVYETFLREGQDAAWGKFFALGSPDAVPVPAGEDDAPAPEPVAPPAGQEANSAYMLAHMLRPTTRYQPDIDALLAAPTRIVVAGGTTSAGQLTHRTADALAGRLGLSLVDFPGDHTGFVAGPEEFAHVLRRQLVTP